MCGHCMYKCVSEGVRECMNVFEFTFMSTEHKPLKVQCTAVRVEHQWLLDQVQ